MDYKKVNCIKNKNETIEHYYSSNKLLMQTLGFTSYLKKWCNNMYQKSRNHCC